MSIDKGNMLGDVYTEPSDWRPEAEAALTVVREHEAGLAAELKDLCDVAFDCRTQGPDNDHQAVPVEHLRRILTDTGAAEALRKHDAEVLRRAANRIEPDVPVSAEVRDWLYDYADRIEAGGTDDRLLSVLGDTDRRKRETPTSEGETA